MVAPVVASAPPPSIRERIAAGIVEAAARVFAEQGGQASMVEVAAAAGISRATLYRYFPSRELLLEQLAQVSLTETGERLRAARLEQVPIPEGLSRAVRALVTVGDHYIVLAREHVQPDSAQFEQQLAAPLRALLERGQAAGEIRTDLSAAWLMEALLGLVAGGLLSGDTLGAEETVAVVSSLFLEGAHARPPGT
jgi:TetR/AcrR family transcriptional regulator, mexCD-oprJ operon repressor